MLRYIDLNVVGKEQHRSGWPYCIDALRPLFSHNAMVLFDDFIERTFLYERKWKTDPPHYMRPWVGILHHPPAMPAWYMSDIRLDDLLINVRWNKALPNLKMLIVLGENLQTFCKQNWPTVPVVTIKHPTGRPMLYWSPERFRANQNRQVVQVGWFLRNTTAIYHAKTPKWLRKAHLVQQENPWSNFALWRCNKATALLYPERGNIGETEKILRMNDTSYDLMLSENVVLVEVISAVANNTVVECIARNTPICINRHPGPEYYLGRDYPLFYDHFDKIEQTLTMENIMAAYDYLRRMDKWWIRGSMFREQVRNACIEHVPECRADAALLPQDHISCEI